MKHLWRYAAAVFVVFAFVCSAAAYGQQVQTDYDHHANFDRYHTYHWKQVSTDDPLYEQRIKDAVDHDLQAKGWQLADQNADVAITAVGATKNQQSYQTFYDGFGGGWGWRGFGGMSTATTSVQNYKVGTLVLDMYDRSTKQLIWRGTASDSLSSKASKNEKNLEKAVDKMLAHFPPKS